MSPAITLAAHLETCTACRRHVAATEEDEGRALECQTPVAMAPGALDAALARLDAGRTAAPRRSEARRRLGDVYLPHAVAEAGLGPRRWLAAGLWAAPIRAPVRDHWRTFLLHTPAGITIPKHGHSGRELIAVLMGGFHDGETYRQGDFAESNSDARHHLTALGDEPCVCLISIQGRIKWRGWAMLAGAAIGM